jgi:hypothetical protein
MLTAAPHLAAVDFSARIIDNYGDPVSGAQILAECNDHGRLRKLFTITSGFDGLAHGTHKSISETCEKHLSVHVTKDGYGRSDYDELRTLYRVKRNVQADDLHRIALLTGGELKTQFRNLITSNVMGDLDGLVFYYDYRFRPVLRSLLDDPDAGVPARRLLGYIGVPEDLRLIAQSKIPKEEGAGFVSQYRWLASVTCSMLQPTSDAEWDLLRGAALGEYNDGWVRRNAIQSLKLNASPQALKILTEVQASNSFRAQLAPAIKYIESNPEPLRGSRLDELGQRLGRILGGEIWTGNGEPKFNGTRDKATIDLNFDTGEDWYLYTAVFQKTEDGWILRSVRETLQALKVPTRSR